MGMLFKSGLSNKGIRFYHGLIGLCANLFGINYLRNARFEPISAQQWQPHHCFEKRELSKSYSPWVYLIGIVVESWLMRLPWMLI